MKNTHTIIDIENLISENYMKLKDPNTSRKEQKECVKRLKYLENHFNSINDKHINGKVYPDPMYHSDDKPMDKQEVLKLIDKVDTYPNNEKNCYTEGCYSTEGTYVPDPSGVFPPFKK